MAIFDTLFAENGIRNNIPTSEQQTGVLSVETGWTQEYAKNPLMGGKFVKLGDMNAIIHDTQKGVNDLEIQLNRRIDNLSGGIQIIQSLNDILPTISLGTQFYCVENENMYLLINNSSLIVGTSTLEIAINTNSVKNITPFDILYKNANFVSVSPNIPTLSSTTATKYKNNTKQTQFINLSAVGNEATISLLFLENPITTGGMCAKGGNLQLVIIPPDSVFGFLANSDGTAARNLTASWDFTNSVVN